MENISFDIFDLVQKELINIVWLILLLALVYLKQKLATVKVKKVSAIKDAIQDACLEVEKDATLKGIHAKNAALKLIESIIGKKLFTKYKRNIEIWIDDFISMTKQINVFTKK